MGDGLSSALPRETGGLLGIVFSGNQPLRLDALLRSFRARCRDADQVRLFVLYRATTTRQRSWYRRLAQEHPQTDFVLERDFQRDLLVLLQGAETVMFLSDENVFVQDFAVADTGHALRRLTSALGCALCLGRNTIYSASGAAQPLPPFQDAGSGLLRFRWTEAGGDFSTPLSLSGTVLRVEDLLPLPGASVCGDRVGLASWLESRSEGFRDSRPWLLCPEQSVAFHAVLLSGSPEADFSEKSGEPLGDPGTSFARGRRIDAAALAGFTPQAARQAVEPRYAAAAPVPLVSVVIPCYRQASFLTEAVQSVVAQTFTDWEIVIVNDGSPDDTGEVARALQACFHDRRIRIIDKANGGLADARNVGVRHSQGAFILPLDADDKLDPQMLGKMLALLEADPRPAIVYTDLARFGAATETICASEFNFRKLCANNQLNYCSLYRREVWESVGGYNSNLIWGYEDWEFWIGGGEHGYHARRLPEKLFFYRVREQSMYSAALAHDKELRARIVANHPALYDHRSRRKARALLAGTPYPAPPGAPLVSVIVPTFNRPQQLEEALRSVLHQTLRDLEIVLVNDGGIDVTPVVARLRAQERVRCVAHPRNRGPAAARNTGLRFARGKYVAYLDDDDVYLPDHLETLVAFLERSGSAVAYTDAARASERLIDGRYAIVSREVPAGPDWDQDRILAHNFVPTLCLMHARACVDRVGTFDEMLSTHEGWDYWIRLSRVFAFHHIPRTTAEFRVREGRDSPGSARADFLRTAQIIIVKYRRFSAGKPEVRSKQGRLVRDLEREIFGKVLRGFERDLLMRKNCLQHRWRRFVQERMGRRVRMNL